MNFRERTPATVGELMGSLVADTDGMQRKMNANQRAAALWSQANGDVERAHTMGVYLREPPNEALPPVLGVYVDSHARLSDFNANKELYLARLSAVGLEVSGIEFKLNRRAGAGAGGRRGLGTDLPAAAKPARDSVGDGLPPLSPEELKACAASCADLPDGLRHRALRAMELSLRREKAEASRASGNVDS